MNDRIKSVSQEELRNLSPDTQAIVRALHAFEQRFSEREDAAHRETNEKIGRLNDMQRQIQENVTKLASGFPGGDPESHRRYHETVIEWRELRNRMVRDALIQASKVGGMAGVGWLAYAIWTAFKMEIVK